MIGGQGFPACHRRRHPPPEIPRRLRPRLSPEGPLTGSAGGSFLQCSAPTCGALLGCSAAHLRRRGVRGRRGTVTDLYDWWDRHSCLSHGGLGVGGSPQTSRKSTCGPHPSPSVFTDPVAWTEHWLSKTAVGIQHSPGVPTGTSR